jgi:hypothetical protein
MTPPRETPQRSAIRSLVSAPMVDPVPPNSRSAFPQEAHMEKRRPFKNSSKAHPWQPDLVEPRPLVEPQPLDSAERWVGASSGLPWAEDRHPELVR